MVAGEGDTVGRHPVLRIGEGGGEIGRTRAHGAVDAGLEGVAFAAPQPLREAPIGAAAGERKARRRVRRQAIVEAGGKPAVRAERSWLPSASVAAAAACAAEAAAPRAPALREARRRRLGDRRLHCLGKGQRDLLRQCAHAPSHSRSPARQRRRGRRVRIEHQIEELAAELECALLGAGRALPSTIARARCRGCRR